MKTLAAIQSFILSRKALGLSPKTIAWYSCKLSRFAHFSPELPQDPEALDEFLSSIPVDENRGDENKHGYYRALRALYRFLRKRKLLPEEIPNPIDLIETPHRKKKVMPTLEPEQLMRLLNSASGLRDRTLLTLLIDTGIRTSELANLQKRDIQSETILVRGKTGQREVPISEETRRLLLAVTGQDGGPSPYVFAGRSGPLSRYAIYCIVKSHMEKAGIRGPKLGAHRVRHAFGKNYLVNGGDLRSLQELMGHSEITTTEKYSSLNLKDNIRKHNQFTPLRSTHATAQQSFLDRPLAVKEAEAILAQKGGEGDN